MEGSPYSCMKQRRMIFDRQRTLGASIMRALVIAAGLIIAAATQAAAAVDQQIGAAAQVVNSVYGSPESTRQSQWLRPGMDVFQNETIVTAESSASRMLFRDKSELAIGPIAQVKLDTFVYNLNPTTAATTISLVKGVFRFTSGTFGQDNYVIETPAARIGLRGTAFTVFIAPNGSELIAVESGAITVTCHKGVTVPLNAGQMTYIPSPTGSAGPGQPATPIPAVNQMDALLR